jgi:hypothetical protein
MIMQIGKKVQLIKDKNIKYNFSFFFRENIVFVNTIFFPLLRNNSLKSSKRETQ